MGFGSHVIGKNGFAHFEEFLIKKVWNVFLASHQEPFNVLHREFAFVLPEML